jgi:AcrR family transcriptional regulator
MSENPNDIGNRSGGALQRTVSEAIIRAAREELAEQGFGRFSIETVARRAGVGKAALYRRWPSKEALLVWLLQGQGLDYAQAPDTGSLIGDLEGYIASAADILGDAGTARIAAHLYAELATESSVAALIRKTIQPLKDEAVRSLLDRAIARGELPDDLDQNLARDLLLGALYWRLVAQRRGLDKVEAAQLAQMLGAALKTPRI